MSWRNGLASARERLHLAQLVDDRDVILPHGLVDCVHCEVSDRWHVHVVVANHGTVGERDVGEKRTQAIDLLRGETHSVAVAVFRPARDTRPANQRGRSRVSGVPGGVARLLRRDQSDVRRNDARNRHVPHGLHAMGGRSRRRMIRCHDTP